MCAHQLRGGQLARSSRPHAHKFRACVSRVARAPINLARSIVALALDLNLLSWPANLVHSTRIILSVAGGGCSSGACSVFVPPSSSLRPRALRSGRSVSVGCKDAAFSVRHDEAIKLMSSSYWHLPQPAPRLERAAGLSDCCSGQLKSGLRKTRSLPLLGVDECKGTRPEAFPFNI